MFDLTFENADVWAAAIDADMKALPINNAVEGRKVRRKYSKLLNSADAAFIFELAHILIEDDKYKYRWVPYELVHFHNVAFERLRIGELEALGENMQGWGEVDNFSRQLSGPAWLKGQIADDDIHRWAQSDNLWWRRAALVSTVALNMRSHGGYGDAPRTLAVCKMLADDHEDMVVKALSWALRVLVVHDPDAVRAFLEEYDSVLASRVKREVRNKLETGLKNPGKRNG